MSKTERIVLAVYAVWAAVAVLLAFLHEGLSPNNFTRLLIIAYLLLGLAWYGLTRKRREAPSALRFVARCSLSALVVEGCYMFSRPVFPSLLVGPGTTAGELVRKTLIDWAFTLPAYVVIFSVFWLLLLRFRYRASEYVILFSLAQALGDGGAFFVANPALLVLAPYVMLNYQAINIVPYLRVREGLSHGRAGGVLRFLAPLLAIPAVYFVMGALIIVVGRKLGLR